jgi:hypothetical protein
MKISHLVKKTVGTGFVLSILLGIGIVSTVNTQAQYRYDPRYQQDRDNRNRSDQDRDRDYRNRSDQDRDYRDRNYQRRGRSSDGYRNYGGSQQLRQTALNAGYNEGSKKGRDDMRHNRRYDFQNSSSFDKATKDYSSRLGDRETYRRYFQDAFENGYADGFRGY